MKQTPQNTHSMQTHTDSHTLTHKKRETERDRTRGRQAEEERETEGEPEGQKARDVLSDTTDADGHGQRCSGGGQVGKARKALTSVCCSHVYMTSQQLVIASGPK